MKKRKYFNLGVSIILIIFMLFTGITFSEAATPVFDFEASISGGKWQYVQGEETVGAVPVNNGVLEVRMADDPEYDSITIVYDDGNIKDIDLRFDLKVELTEVRKDKEWTAPDTWCFIMAIRDTYYPHPFWNGAETGSYTYMYHPKASNRSYMSFFSWSNRPSKRGEAVHPNIPYIADNNWHSLRFVVEDVGSDKVHILISIDGENYINYETVKTSEKGYISFRNEYCSMKMRPFTGIGSTGESSAPDPTNPPAPTLSSQPTAAPSMPDDSSEKSTVSEDISVGESENEAPDTSQADSHSGEEEFGETDIKSKSGDIEIDLKTKKIKISQPMNVREFLEDIEVSDKYRINVLRDDLVIANKDKMIEGEKFTAKVMEGEEEVVEFQIEIEDKSEKSSSKTKTIIIIVIAAIVIAGAGTAIYYTVIKKRNLPQS